MRILRSAAATASLRDAAHNDVHNELHSSLLSPGFGDNNALCDGAVLLWHENDVLCFALTRVSSQKIAGETQPTDPGPDSGHGPLSDARRPRSLPAPPPPHRDMMSLVLVLLLPAAANQLPASPAPLQKL